MKSKENDFREIIEILIKHNVEFIVVGGVCAVLQGAPVTTFDLDIVHNRSTENIEKLDLALQELEAYYRTRNDIRIKPEKKALMKSGHHLLMTNKGPLDVLGAIGKSEEYNDLIKNAEETEIMGKKVLLQSLENLIKVKQYLAGEKDKTMIPILQKTLEEKKRRG